MDSLPKDKYLRKGQEIYNRLHEVNPELSLQICGTDEDPYFDDDKLYRFWIYIEEHWYR